MNFTSTLRRPMLSVVVSSALSVLSTVTVSAQPVGPEVVNGFATLADKLGDTIGRPVEPERPGDEPGSVVQKTTTGLAYWAPHRPPSFFDGHKRWAVSGPQVLSWVGEDPDPPPPPAPSSPRVAVQPSTSLWDM